MENENQHETASAAGDRVAPRKVALLLLILAAVLGLAWPLFAWVGQMRSGLAGVIAAAAAGAVCYVAAALALLLVALVRDPQQAVTAVLGGMVLRTGIPLAFGIAMKERGGILAEGEILAMVLPYYLLTLVTETCLSLKLIPTRGSRQSTIRQSTKA